MERSVIISIKFIAKGIKHNADSLRYCTPVSITAVSFVYSDSISFGILTQQTVNKIPNDTATIIEMPSVFCKPLKSFLPQNCAVNTILPEPVP